MTKFKLRAFLISTVASASLVFASVAVATIVLTPDSAFAKGDKGKGNGKGNGNGKGKGNGKSKGGNDKAGKGANADKSKSKIGKSHKEHKFARANKTLRSTKANKGKNGKLQRTSLSGFGREFKRDVEELFGKRSRTPRSGTKSKRKIANSTYNTSRKTSVAPIEKSLRPVTRKDNQYTSYDGKKRGKRHYRDPLVAAITDPYGSDKLRNLNASNAAAPALRNASSNSNVGKIATYQEAANNYYDLQSELYDARRDLRDLNKSYDGRTSHEIADDIADLDPNDPDYDEKLGALENELRDAETYEETRDHLRGDIKDLRSETGDALHEAEAAFFDASKGRTLTRSTLGDFHSNLGLPQPKDRYPDDVKIQPEPYGINEPDYSKDHKNPPNETRYQLDDDDAYSDNKKRGKRHYRDPLVAAITDPYGSDKLRNLSASNAAAPAFSNAAANSNVGKIATYQEAAADYYDLRSDLYDARRELRDLNERYDGRSSDEIADDIADLDPSDPNYDDNLDRLEKELRVAEAYEDARDDLRANVKDLHVDTTVAQKQAERAFFDASKGSVLTPDALAELHGNLNLPTTNER